MASLSTIFCNNCMFFINIFPSKTSKHYKTPGNLASGVNPLYISALDQGFYHFSHGGMTRLAEPLKQQLPLHLLPSLDPRPRRRSVKQTTVLQRSRFFSALGDSFRGRIPGPY